MSQVHDADPITDRTHDETWSANLERARHAERRALVVQQAVEAVEHTAPGAAVNLVTHGAHGHPESYLYDRLRETFDGIEIEHLGRCGCDGHVTQVVRT